MTWIPHLHIRQSPSMCLLQSMKEQASERFNTSGFHFRGNPYSLNRESSFPKVVMPVYPTVGRFTQCAICAGTLTVDLESGEIPTIVEPAYQVRSWKYGHENLIGTWHSFLKIELDVLDIPCTQRWDILSGQQLGVWAVYPVLGFEATLRTGESRLQGWETLPASFCIELQFCELCVAIERIIGS